MIPYKILFLVLITLISCSSPNPEKIKKQILNTSCKEIVKIVLTDFDDNSENKIEITDENRVCEIFTILKEKTANPHFEYLPTNTHIDSFVMLVYGKEEDLIFHIQSGIFNNKNGYIILMNTHIGIVDMRLISDVDFPLKVLQIIEEKSLQNE